MSQISMHLSFTQLKMLGIVNIRLTDSDAYIEFRDGSIKKYTISQDYLISKD